MRGEKRCSSCSDRVLFWKERKGETLCLPCFFSEVRAEDVANFGELAAIARDMRMCVYCGEVAEEVEHVVPRCSGFLTWTVPACGECNRIASGNVFESFADKRAFIKSGISMRHAKVLRMPEWDEEEIREMGPTLQKDIRRHKRAREIVLQRMRFEVEMLACIRDEESA